MTLCNLTNEKANQEHVVKQGLPPLIRLNKSPTRTARATRA